jgi:hypothetical protein
VWVIEQGYIRSGDRWAVSLLDSHGVHNNNGYFLEGQKCPSDRLEEIGVSITHTKGRDGKRALIMGQVEGDTQLGELNFEQWKKDTIERLEGKGYEVNYRPHPVVETPTQSLFKDLAQCDLACAYNSTSLVECIRLGVPFICDENCQYISMATDLDNPRAKSKREREQFMQNLAYCQYTPEEYRNGEAWEHMKRLYELRNG